MISYMCYHTYDMISYHIYRAAPTWKKNGSKKVNDPLGHCRLTWRGIHCKWQTYGFQRRLHRIHHWANGLCTAMAHVWRTHRQNQRAENKRNEKSAHALTLTQPIIKNWGFEWLQPLLPCTTTDSNLSTAKFQKKPTILPDQKNILSGQAPVRNLPINLRPKQQRKRTNYSHMLKFDKVGDFRLRVVRGLTLITRPDKTTIHPIPTRHTQPLCPHQLEPWVHGIITVILLQNIGRNNFGIVCCVDIVQHTYERSRMLVSIPEEGHHRKRKTENKKKRNWKKSQKQNNTVRRTSDLLESLRVHHTVCCLLSRVQQLLDCSVGCNNMMQRALIYSFGGLVLFRWCPGTSPFNKQKMIIFSMTKNTAGPRHDITRCCAYLPHSQPGIKFGLIAGNPRGGEARIFFGKILAWHMVLVKKTSCLSKIGGLGDYVYFAICDYFVMNHRTWGPVFGLHMYNKGHPNEALFPIWKDLKITLQFKWTLLNLKHTHTQTAQQRHNTTGTPPTPTHTTL